MLWQVVDSPLKLLGSFHQLRAIDHPLPSEIYGAYHQSDVLVLESNFLDPRIASIGFYSGSRTLADDAPADFQAAVEALHQHGVAEAFVRTMKPWKAAATVAAVELARQGFGAEYGVDPILFQLARQGGKGVRFLEDPLEGFRHFEEATIEAQLRFLRFSLAERGRAVAELTRVIQSWRQSTPSAIEELAFDRLKRFPEIFGGLLTARNHAWIPKILELTNSSEPTLVSVGALHCVGSEGVIALLARQGLTADLIPFS